MPGSEPGSKRTVWHFVTRLCACASLLLLGACSDLSRSLVQTVRGGVLGGPPVPASPAEVAARPLFQILATTRHGEALLILGNVDGIREAWYGPAQTAVFLERGRIVQTANLEANLVASRIIGADPFTKGLQNIADSVDYDSVDDWSPGFRYGVPVHGRLTRAGIETVTILERPRQLLRIDETRQSDVAQWVVHNHYWVDPATGFIWKSDRMIVPGVRIQMIQLKPRLQGGP